MNILPIILGSVELRTLATILCHGTGCDHAESSASPAVKVILRIPQINPSFITKTTLAVTSHSAIHRYVPQHALTAKQL